MKKNIAAIIVELRKAKGWSQTELAAQSKVSREIIGKYERGEAVPSIEFAKLIADAFGVSLDYLAGEGTLSKLDKKTVKRFQDIEALKDDDKNHLLAIVDVYLRDASTRRAYAY
jgi:transcriptional regulator with XRE-family HTH domain